MENTPLINPIWFYLMGISDTLSHFLSQSCFLGVAGCVIIIAATGLIEYSEDSSLPEDKLKRIRSMRLKSFRFIIVFFLIGLFGVIVPKQNVIRNMIIASQVTPKNIKTVSETVKSVGDYTKTSLIDVIHAIKDDVKDEIDKKSK